jgi:hypothetical protein
MKGNRIVIKMTESVIAERQYLRIAFRLMNFEVGRVIQVVQLVLWHLEEAKLSTARSSVAWPIAQRIINTH